MERQPRSDNLLVWSLATFHTGLFVLIPVVLLYLNGALGNLLRDLSTMFGVTVFGALWLTNWWCTRRAARGIDWTALLRPVFDPRLLARGIVWGGINGILLLLALLIIALALLAPGAIANQGLEAVSNFVAFGVFVLLLGLPIAFIIGAIMGLVFAVIDGILLQVSLYLLRASTRPEMDRDRSSEHPGTN
jgi:hypothetical protein